MGVKMKNNLLESIIMRLYVFKDISSLSFKLKIEGIKLI